MRLRRRRRPPAPPGHLFDPELVERRPGALVALPRWSCPECGAELDETFARQGSLLRHGGYGADRLTVTRYCTADRCGWSFVSLVAERRPLPPARCRFETVTPAERYL
jgi:hypothetical protein